MTQLSEKIQEAIRAKRDEKLKSNAEYQRRNQMTKEERARDAKDRMTKNIHEHLQQQTGGRSSYADAERKVDQVVDRFVKEIEK